MIYLRSLPSVLTVIGLVVGHMGSWKISFPDHHMSNDSAAIHPFREIVELSLPCGQYEFTCLPYISIVLAILRVKVLV